MFFVTETQRLVFLGGERAAFLGTRLFENGGAVWKERSDTRGQVGLCVWIVEAVSIWEVSPESEWCNVYMVSAFVPTEGRIAPRRDAPIFKINGGASLKLELGVVENGLPIAYSPLLGSKRVE